MTTFQILCVTMNQTDFSKLKEMNIRSDVIFANQADCTGVNEITFDGHTAKMITTDTRGVGINRNLALMYANADICLFADDDVTYVDDMESIVVEEFKSYPDADVMIFHLDTDDRVRREKKYQKTRKCGRFERMPWGAFRIAFRLNSAKKANLWFTPLFGGGCIFPSGEDSMWLNDAKKRGLTFYVSEKTIGTVSFENSTWFTGYDEKFFYAKGVFCEAIHPRMTTIWLWYYALRMRNMCDMPWSEKMKWMRYGIQGYREMLSFEDFKRKRLK